MNNTSEEFRLAIVNFEPFFSACANNTSFTIGRTLQCPQPGSYYEMFQIYVQVMAVKPILTWMGPKQFGAYDNGSWTGDFEMLLNGTFDTVAASYQQTELREQYFDFSFSYYEVRLVYLVKEVKSSVFEKMLDIFLPFDYDVWLLCLMTVFALLIACSFIYVSTEHSIKEAQLKSVRPKSDSVWSYYRYLVNSCGRDVILNSYSGTILFISGGIFALIVTNLYGGVLLSQLLIDPVSNPFSTADAVLKLIEQKKYKMIFVRTNPSFWYYQETTNSNDTHYVQLRKALSKNPYAFADDTTEAMKMVRSGGYILPALTDDEQVYGAFNACDVAIVSPEGFPSKYATFIFRKNSPFLKRLNEAIFSTQTLTDRIWNSYYGEDARQKRLNNCKRSNTRSPLSIESCSGFFALLFVGFLLAILVLVIEKIVQEWSMMISEVGERIIFEFFQAYPPYSFSYA